MIFFKIIISNIDMIKADVCNPIIIHYIEWIQIYISLEIFTSVKDFPFPLSSFCTSELNIDFLQSMLIPPLLLVKQFHRSNHHIASLSHTFCTRFNLKVSWDYLKSTAISTSLLDTYIPCKHHRAEAIYAIFTYY